jgi:hypothetical protein
LSRVVFSATCDFSSASALQVFLSERIKVWNAPSPTQKRKIKLARRSCLRGSTMTLAVLFLFWMSHAFLPASLAQDQSPSAPQTQAGTPQAQNPPSSTATPSSPVTSPAKSSATKHAKKKKSRPVNCDSAPAQGPSPASTAGTGDTSQAQTSGSPPQTNTPPSDCPPTKRIVRQGGTSEPSIQLAGGDPASPPSDINHMLASTDDNLKKLSGRTLSSDQQGTVTQIHLFADQSRAALKGGDLDRARTLAKKAQSLSDELVNPQQ